jgi:hypothetical protein
MHSKGGNFPNRFLTQVLDKILYTNEHSIYILQYVQKSHSVMDLNLREHKLLVQVLLQKEPFLNTDSSPDNKLRKKPY